MTQMSNDSYGDGNVYRGQRSRDSAVKTITLAQPEQCRKEKHENGEYVCNCKAGECPQFAQPEQEPVVGTKTWFEDGKVVTQYLYPSDIYTTPPQPEQEPCDMKDMCIGCSPRNADGSCPDAQRKPLTDEQIDEIYFKSSLVVVNRCDDMYDFVRAIEAAHGIKE